MGELHSLKTSKLQYGRRKEVNDVLKDFDELERTGLGPGNAIVARRYSVKYGKGDEGERGRRGAGGIGGGEENAKEEGYKRAKDVGDIEIEGGGIATGRLERGWLGEKEGEGREAAFDGPRVSEAPAGSDADRKPEIQEKRRSETKSDTTRAAERGDGNGGSRS